MSLIDSERIQTVVYQIKQQRWPIVLIFGVSFALSWFLARSYYIDKYTLDSAEYVEINQTLQAKNEELSGQIKTVNDGHTTAMAQVEYWQDQALIAQTEKEFLQNNPQVEYLTQTERVFISPTDCRNLTHVKQAQALYNENNLYYHDIID